MNMTSEDKIRMVPDSLCQSRHPNMYIMGFDADLSKRKKDTVTPFVLVNLSHTENLRLREDTVVGFAEKDNADGKVFQVETLDTTPRNWTNPRTFALFARIGDLRLPNGPLSGVMFCVVRVFLLVVSIFAKISRKQHLIG